MLELKVSKFLMEIWFEVEFENHEHVSSVTGLQPTNYWKTLNTAMLVINK